jgi:hypothetical protein
VANESLIVEVRATMEIKRADWTQDTKWNVASKRAQQAIDHMVLVIKDGLSEPIRVHVDAVGITVNTKA